MSNSLHEDPLKTLVENASDYIETRIELIRLKTLDKSSSVLSSTVSRMIIILGIVLIIFIFCLGLSFYLGELLGRTYYGFFVMGGILTVALMLLYGFRERWIKSPFADMIVKNFFKP
jgi:hypothetical protein